MSFFKKISLPFVVFLTGACVLVIEVVATRILSPYYGNTIFTVSSVISVVLAALSLGYYLGGKLADRHPSEKVFYGIILASGGSVLLLELLTLCILPFLGYGLSIIIGPIISSLVLFLLPNILLGTLSPFAIKLYSLTQTNKGTGSVAGDIFFWSTMGSILGSLSAGFIFIPYCGVHTIIMGVGVVLILLGALPLIGYGIKRSIVGKILLGVTAITFLLHTVASATPARVIYSHDGIYEKITVYDGEYDGKPARFLSQDRSTSAAMFLNSNDLVYDYTTYYQLYKLFKPDLKTALVIGGGAYSIPKALLNQTSTQSVDVSEIEPSLFAIGKTYFNIPDDSRLHNYTDDGRRLLHDTTKTYDLIFSDVYYSLYSIPTHFTTKEFFQIAKNKLSPNGVFMANLIGNLSRQEPSLILSEMNTFRSVFPNSYFFAVHSPTSTQSQNIIFVGYNSTTQIDFKSTAVTNNAQPLIRRSGAHLIDPERFMLSQYPMLTDDYAPIEYLTSRILEQSVEALPDKTDGSEVLALIAQQLHFGPRYMSAPGHTLERDFIERELRALGLTVIKQPFDYTDKNNQVHHLINIIGSIEPSSTDRIILGTHYDSMRYAKFDIDWTTPPPGANNSASGVAVLLETARYMSAQTNKRGIDFIFFDGEEGDESVSKPETSWNEWRPLGSEYFVKHLTDVYRTSTPQIGIIVDVVCGKNQTVSIEDPRTGEATELANEFKKIADTQFPSLFNDRNESEIKDDHTTLTTAHIPSILLIDHDYPYLDTMHDTIDKCSAEKLEHVGNILINFVTR